jgi:hypothetical protein
MKPPVIAFLLDDGQARGVIEDLQMGLERGGDVFFILCDPNPPEEGASRQVDASLDEVPAPDNVVGGQIITIAMQGDPGEMMRKMGFLRIQGEG